MINYWLSNSHHNSSDKHAQHSHFVLIEENSSSVSFSRQNCWHTSPVKWPLSVPLCQCVLLIRDCLSWLPIIQSVWSRLVASGHNLAVSSSAEVISHHFITFFHQSDSLSDTLMLGICPRNHSYIEGHLQNATGSKSNTAAQMEYFFLFFSHMVTSGIKDISKQPLTSSSQG